MNIFHQQLFQSSAGTSTASGRRRRTWDHAFIAYWSVPSPPQDMGRLHVGCMVVAGGPIGQTCFGLGGGCSRCSLLPSRSLSLSLSRPGRTCVRVGPPATGSGPMRPAGLAVAGRRRRVRVASKWSSLPRRGRRGAWAGLRGRPEPAGPSITEGRVSGIKTINAMALHEATYRGL